MRLSIFSHAFWPSLCLLWRNVYLGLLPILFKVFFYFYFLILSCVSCVYNLEIKPLSAVSFADVFSIMCVKFVQLCPTLCYPMNCTVRGILQARILEWIAYAFSRGSSQPGIEPRSPALQVDSLPTELSYPLDCLVNPKSHTRRRS